MAKAIITTQPNIDDVLNMVWASEPGVSVFVFKAANPQGEADERRVIQIRKGEAVLASATIERHNRDNLAESIGTTDLRYSSEEVGKVVKAALTGAAMNNEDEQEHPDA